MSDELQPKAVAKEDIHIGRHQDRQTAVVLLFCAKDSVAKLLETRTMFEPIDPPHSTVLPWGHFQQDTIQDNPRHRCTAIRLKILFNYKWESQRLLYGRQLLGRPHNLICQPTEAFYSTCMDIVGSVLIHPRIVYMCFSLLSYALK